MTNENDGRDMVEITIRTHRTNIIPLKRALMEYTRTRSQSPDATIRYWALVTMPDVLHQINAQTGVMMTNICELAHTICETCGTRIKWGLRVCDACLANEHDDDLTERCDHCDEPAFAICAVCDATMCKRHTVIKHDDEYCHDCAIVPYITCA